jgi:predicted esterase
MTRHERESAIENNHNYLNSLLNTLLIKYTIKPTIKILGFSQGAATATRWVSQLNVPVKSLVLWAGGFAHDLDFEEIGEKLKESEVLFVTGDSDDLITPESISKQDELISRLSCEVKKLQFEGGHELEIPLLKKIFDQ